MLTSRTDRDPLYVDAITSAELNHVEAPVGSKRLILAAHGLAQHLPFDANGLTRQGFRTDMPAEEPVQSLQ